MLTGYVLGRGTGAQEPDGDEPVHRPGPQDCPQAWRREEDRLLFLQPGCLHHVSRLEVLKLMWLKSR